MHCVTNICQKSSSQQCKCYHHHWNFWILTFFKSVQLPPYDTQTPQSCEDFFDPIHFILFPVKSSTKEVQRKTETHIVEYFEMTVVCIFLARTLFFVYNISYLGNLVALELLVLVTESDNINLNCRIIWKIQNKTKFFSDNINSKWRKPQNINLNCRIILQYQLNLQNSLKSQTNFFKP